MSRAHRYADKRRRGLCGEGECQQPSRIGFTRCEDCAKRIAASLRALNVGMKYGREQAREAR